MKRIFRLLSHVSANSLIVFCLIFCQLSYDHASCQTTIPFTYFKKPIDSLTILESKNAATGDKPSYPFRLFPSIKYKDFFENYKPQFFENNVISYNDSLSNIALYSEIASDFIGPVRISAGLTLVYPKSDTNTLQQQKINREKFIQRFSTGGGGLVFNLALPVFVYKSQFIGTAMTFTPRFSLDPPSFGVTSGRFAHNTALGTDLQFEVRGIRDIIKFFGNARLSYVAGNSAFYDGVELMGSSRHGFTFNNYIIGVNIKDVFTLSYTKFWGSKNVNEKLSQFLSFTVQPGFKD